MHWVPFGLVPMCHLGKMGFPRKATALSISSILLVSIRIHLVAMGAMLILFRFLGLSLFNKDLLGAHAAVLEHLDV